MRSAPPAAAALPRSCTPAACGYATLVVLLLVVSLAHPSATRMHTWPWALAAGLCWLLAVALAIGAWLSPQTAIWPNRLLPSGLLVLAAAAVTSAATSPFPAASLPRIWPALGGAALYVALHHSLSAGERDPGGPRTVLLAWVAAGIGAGVMAVSLASWWGGAWPPPWGTRNAEPFGHSIYTAGFTVLALPWLAWAGWRTRGGARLAWGTMFVIGLLVLASTSSRGGALVLGTVATVAAATFLLRGGWTGRQKAIVVLGCTTLAVAAVLANPRLRTLVRERAWSDAAQESNRQRSAMLQAGLQLGAQRPLLGWGPGTVPLAYPRVRYAIDGGVDNVLQLHNTPVQLWATLGLAGLAGALLLLTGAAQAAVAARREPRGRPLRIAAIASLGGYALFALTDHQLDVPLFNAFAAAALAILTAGAVRPAATPSPPRHRPGLLVGLGSGVALLALPLLRETQVRRLYSSGLDAREAGRTSDWLAALQRSAELAPHDPYFRHQAANALLRQREVEREPGRRRALAHTAMQHLRDSLRTGVHQEYAHFNLAWLNLEFDQPAEAARHFLAAARLAPDKGGVYFGLGLAWQDLGRPEAAVRAFALEWLNDPASMGSPAWELPHLASLRDAVAAELRRLYSQLSYVHPPAARAEAWARWWWGDGASKTALPNEHSVESRTLGAALASLDSGQPENGDARWSKLYRAWREPATAERFLDAAAGDTSLAAALHRRSQRHRASFHQFLTAPAGDEPALVRTFRRQRTGYGVLALHPDGPVLTDEYIVQENRLVTEFLLPWLPPKGWLPGRLLLPLLPPAPAAMNEP